MPRPDPDEPVPGDPSLILPGPLPDRAGALAEVVRVCAENQIGIEYAYAFLSAKPDTACLILRTSDHAQAVLTLARNGIKTATQEELFMM